MKKIIIYFLAALLLSTSLFVITENYEIPKVLAVGDTSVEFHSWEDGGQYTGGSWTGSSYPLTWFGYCTAPACGTSGGSNVGWFYSDHEWEHAIPQFAVISFNVTSIPEGSVIKSAYLKLKNIHKYDTANNYDNFAFSAYKTNPGEDNTWDITDNTNWHDMKIAGTGGRMSAPVWFSQVTEGNYFTLLIPDNTASKALTAWDNGFVYFEIMTEYQALYFPPNYSGEDDHTLNLNNSVSEAYLYVTYTPPAAERTESLHTNDDIDSDPLGTEVADNITLETLSCMYADETLSFLVNGESGANITCQLIDEDNNVLYYHDDSIRTDGIYSYQVKLSNSYSGFVRLREIKFNLFSQWVCVQPSPDDSELPNNTYSGNTKYADYTKPFSYYIVNDGDLMYIHWKTNITSSNFTEFCLMLASNGNKDSPVFYSSIDNLGDYYFYGTETNRNNLLHWRYAVFTPGTYSGFENYGGLIVNLALNSDETRYHGFIEPLIVLDADQSEFATPQSAYWYVDNEINGIEISLSKTEYKTDENIYVLLSVGEQCKAEYYLPICQVEFVGGSSFYYEVKLGDNSYNPGNYGIEGDFTARIHINNPSYTSYQFIYDIDFSISGETAEDETPGIPQTGDWWQNLKNILNALHLDNTAGHYLLVIIGILVAVILGIATKNIIGKIACFALAVIIAAASIIGGWVDVWVTVLIAIGAGFAVWALMRKKATGQGEG